MSKAPTLRGQALVALMKDAADWRLAQEQLWYRIPVASAPRRWPPQWLAFYQTKIFGDEAYSVRYFGAVRAIRRVPRRALFPDEIPNAKSEREYYQVFLRSLQTLSRPIISRRLRRIVFIPTTYEKLLSAEEINDLFDDSPLENALWDELKKRSMNAERQVFVKADGKYYALDFALYCENGHINIETDGDMWHTDAQQIPEDNARNNALTAQGWRVLRFNGLQIREQMEAYCVPQIYGTVNQLGGTKGDVAPSLQYKRADEGTAIQGSLFDSGAMYRADAISDDAGLNEE